MVYTKEMWDKIYMEHCEDAPWMLDEYSMQVQTLLDRLIDTTRKGQHILEYGCGNGKVAMHFQQMGMYVDMADISHVLIEFLRRKYEGSGMGIIEAGTPEDLGKARYDVIIVWCVLHHIAPEEWSFYLDGFHRLLRPKGALIIGGWDETDPVILRDNHIALYTQRETWFINSMAQVIDSRKFSVVDSDMVPIKNPLFQDLRRFRYFKLIKVRKQRIK